MDIRDSKQNQRDNREESFEENNLNLGKGGEVVINIDTEHFENENNDSNNNEETITRLDTAEGENNEFYTIVRKSVHNTQNDTEKYQNNRLESLGTPTNPHFYPKTPQLATHTDFSLQTNSKKPENTVKMKRNTLTMKMYFKNTQMSDLNTQTHFKTRNIGKSKNDKLSIGSLTTQHKNRPSIQPNQLK